MQDMITTRKEMANEMLHFSETDFAKKGIHALFGELTLQQWINIFLLHEGDVYKRQGLCRKRSFASAVNRPNS